MTQYCFEVLDSYGTVKSRIPVPVGAVIGRPAEGWVPGVPIPTAAKSAGRSHAILEEVGGEPFLRDQSKVGTIVNGRVLHGETIALSDMDMIVFGSEFAGWRVRFRILPEDEITETDFDPLQHLAVSAFPREIRIGDKVVEDHLKGRLSFRLLNFLADNKGRTFPSEGLERVVWPDLAPGRPVESLSHYVKEINDLLRPYLGEAAIEHDSRGYRMKPRISRNSPDGKI